MRLALAVLTLLASLPAHAKCAPPRAFTLPAPGTALPVNPTLYFFGPQGSGYMAPLLKAVSEAGALLPLASKQLEGGGNLEVWRLSITAAAGTSFHLEPVLGDGVPWTVKAGAPAQGELVVARGKDHFSSWTCSYTSLRVLSTNFAAPAYKVEFAEDEAALRAGKGASVVVDGGAASVDLGHHSCRGKNMEWPSPTLAVRVTALLVDGSERRSATLFTLEKPPEWGD